MVTNQNQHLTIVQCSDYQCEPTISNMYKLSHLFSWSVGLRIFVFLFDRYHCCDELKIFITNLPIAHFSITGLQLWRDASIRSGANGALFVIFSLQIINITGHWNPRNTKYAMDDVTRFSLTVNDLTELMELRGNKAYEEIDTRFGGTEQLCEMLYVSSTEGKRQTVFKLFSKMLKLWIQESVCALVFVCILIFACDYFVIRLTTCANTISWTSVVIDNMAWGFAMSSLACRPTTVSVERVLYS